jgi:hypothetical protein
MRRVASLAEHFGHDENENGSNQTSTEDEVEQGKAYGGKHRDDRQSEHKLRTVPGFGSGHRCWAMTGLGIV